MHSGIWRVHEVIPHPAAVGATDGFPGLNIVAPMSPQGQVIGAHNTLAVFPCAGTDHIGGACARTAGNQFACRIVTALLSGAANRGNNGRVGAKTGMRTGVIPGDVAKIPGPSIVVGNTVAVGVFTRAFGQLGIPRSQVMVCWSALTGSDEHHKSNGRV